MRGLFTKGVIRSLCLLLGFSCALRAKAQEPTAGQFRNPILQADYSDPDVIRVGRAYYLVASSFHFMPGVPVLRSTDLLHWKIVGHVFPSLDFDPKYDMIGGTRYGGGAWAPSIRFHKGRYFVYFPTPNEGIFMSSSLHPDGPWTKPIPVISGAGYEDPCPFWDEDGKAYLVHSRLGAGPLILHRMSQDGRSILDEGRVIVQDSEHLPTLEGPKLYKRYGYYYIFAPYGGVATGAEVVLRSKNIWGPYDYRVVLKQGTTIVHGPHQGGYVETPTGQGWFLHFHSDGAYGRIDDLEPVHWIDDWPVIGRPIEDGTVGEPVQFAAKPKPVKVTLKSGPRTSDEFSSGSLSPQWEWNHNPDGSHWSLTENRGFLRLHAMAANGLLEARDTLTELPQDRGYSFTVSLNLGGLSDGQRAGVSMFCDNPGEIFIVRTSSERRVEAILNGKVIEGPMVNADTLQLRIMVAEGKASYASSSDDGHTFIPLGEPTPFVFSWWKGARPSIFTFTSSKEPGAGYVDVDWVHYQAMP